METCFLLVRGGQGLLFAEKSASPRGQGRDMGTVIVTEGDKRVKRRIRGIIAKDQDCYDLNMQP